MWSRYTPRKALGALDQQDDHFNLVLNMPIEFTPPVDLPGVFYARLDKRNPKKVVMFFNPIRIN